MQQLVACVGQIRQSMCANRRLKLNKHKTQFIWLDDYCLYFAVFCRDNIKELFGGMNDVESDVFSCLHLKSTFVCYNLLECVSFQLFLVLFVCINFTCTCSYV